MAPEHLNLAVGKLPAEELRRLLSKVEPDPSVIIGPQIGEDAAVLDFGDRCLVVTTDPVTFAADRIGWYVVHINANDVAVMGARPRWFFAVVLLPEGQSTSEMMNDIMTDIRGTCAVVGATLAGGHTEITSNLTRPIVVGQMLGDAPATRLVNKQRLTVGDQLLLTQGVAIEGTAILAREKSSLLADHLDPETLDRAERLLFTSSPASASCKPPRWHSMRATCTGCTTRQKADWPPASRNWWIRPASASMSCESEFLCSQRPRRFATSWESIRWA